MGLRAWTCLLAASAACGDNLAGEDRQGGDTTVDDRTQNALLHPAANLTDDERARFQLGTSPFDFHWEIPQLGPLFNNDACFGCHVSFGRGLSQIGGDGIIDINGPQSEALVRVSLPDGAPGDPGGPIPVPGYGTQLQDHATIGLPEVLITLEWVEHEELFGDGSTISLRAPRLTIRDGNGDPIPITMKQSYRIAPPIIGLGLLEAIDEGTLEALADPDDADGDGISGRINRVWDPEQGATVIGRFGWKANTATLHVQAAGAALNDMGLTNKVFPEPDGNRDIQDDQMEAMVFLVSTVGVPAAAPRGPAAARGRRLFDDFGCSSCHVPTLVTGAHAIPEVAHQTIHPYTDLLLHDMGDLLTDSRPDFLAEGVEWRTPALWGIGLAHVVRDNVGFLHDGRARTYAEAIMWHHGEAEQAREAFRTAPKADRDALAAFLDTL
jgi:CxxC motif-containing protein (DUF1111 family)